LRAPAIAAAIKKAIGTTETDPVVAITDPTSEKIEDIKVHFILVEGERVHRRA
jgi:hypothetical protein